MDRRTLLKAFSVMALASVLKGRATLAEIEVRTYTAFYEGVGVIIDPENSVIRPLAGDSSPRQIYGALKKAWFDRPELRSYYFPVECEKGGPLKLKHSWQIVG